MTLDMREDLAGPLPFVQVEDQPRNVLALMPPIHDVMKCAVFAGKAKA